MSMKGCVHDAPVLGDSIPKKFASVVSQTESAAVRFRGDEVLRVREGYIVVIRSMFNGFMSSPVIINPRYWFADVLHATVACH